MIVSQDEELRKALQRNPHLKEYLRKGAREFGTPKFVKTLDRSMADERDINIIYPVGDPVFIHIFRQSNGELLYRVVEPFLSEKEKELMVKVRHASVGLASDYEKEPETKEEHEKILKDLIRRVTSTGLSLRERLRKLFLGSEKVLLSEETLKKITYYLIRDLVYMGRIQPFLMDPYLEDVSSIGTHGIFVYHKYFGSIKTDSRFESLRELDRYLTELASAIDKRLSLGEPILDGNLYEGSRVNIIYGTDVSRRGSSFSIRKFEALPFSITQLIDMNTLSAEEAAYLWLCIENGMNIFFCGEAASGKTTTLRAATVFIKPNDKIYSVEDTPELKVLHKNWQRLLTKEKRAEPFDLVKASLRSRPDYIIVGEIRGREGFAAFQAMQTGHPLMATFHAGDIKKVIQRITSPPINIPETFVDNLNVALFQEAIYEGGKIKRRVISVDEIEGYYEEFNKIVTRKVFQWNPYNDTHEFIGLYNSYVLEEKIAKMLGYPDPRKIYDDLKERTAILNAMVREKIFDFEQVFEVVKKYYSGGVEALPFAI